MRPSTTAVRSISSSGTTLGLKSFLSGALRSIPRCDRPSGQPPQHYSLSVHWGNGASGSIDMPECAGAPDTLAPRCQALAASDLSGDRRDELVLLLENGPVSWMEAYELSESEAFGQQPVTVAPPGDLPDFAPGKPFVVHVGTDPLGSVTCRTTDTKQRQIIVSYSRVSDDHTSGRSTRRCSCSIPV
jgi:hypothetical protein